MSVSIIVDSGATVTRWCIRLQKDAPPKEWIRYEGPGLNPNYVPESLWKERIEHQVLEPLQDRFEKWEVEEIFFYCAGCGTEAQLHSVVRTLQDIFPRARITAHHDLVGAARALAGNQPAYIVIAGTGSSTGFYDGKEIQFRHGGTGYILNDEGSATAIGKQLLNAWLNEELPRDLHKAFQSFLNMTREEIFHKIYQDAQHSAVFLGNVARFALENYPNQPFLTELIETALDALVIHHLIPLRERVRNQKQKPGKGISRLPVHGLGGVLASVPDLWKKILKKHRFTPGEIARDALEGLTRFHWSHDRQTA